MNKKQRIVILIGVIILLFNGIFLPYEGEYRRPRSENVKAYLGYYFFFSPPQPFDVRIEFGFYGTDKSLMFFHSYVLTDRVWLQIGIISIVIIGLYFLFKTVSK